MHFLMAETSDHDQDEDEDQQHKGHFNGHPRLFSEPPTSGRKTAVLSCGLACILGSLLINAERET